MDTYGNTEGEKTPASKGFTRVPPDERRCTHVYEDGEKAGLRCVGWSMKDSAAQLCAGHAGVGVAASPEAARAAQAVGAARRSEEAQKARETPQQVYRRLLREHAEKLGARLLDIAANGNDADSLRAIEQLTSRVMGKPKDTIEVETKTPSSIDDLRAMTMEERRAFIRAHTRAVNED